MKPILFSLPGNEHVGDLLAKELGVEMGQTLLRRFPDGETYVRLSNNISGREVILVCTLHAPDDKLLPLYFTSQTARDLGATKIGFVAPYLAYMRQDKQFQEGEGITSAYFARLISSFADWLVTIDPHLHRRASLNEIYRIPNRTLHAASLLAGWIKSHVERPLLIGPDNESEQWVADTAREAQAPHLVLKKIRYGDRNVEVSVPDVEKWRSHTPVLVDDIISTARTMIETVTHLKNSGMRPPVCIGVHAVFAGQAYQELLRAGAERVVTCNTIPHKTNAIDVTGLLSEGIKEMGEKWINFD